MDEVVAILDQFQHELTLFNDNLQGSFRELNRCHEVVDTHWHDTLRKEYDARWLALEERMQQYVRGTGQNYVDVLVHKTNTLKRYLHGY